MQHYLLTINDKQLIEISRQIETNSLTTDNKLYIAKLLRYIVDQRVNVEETRVIQKCSNCGHVNVYSPSEYKSREETLCRKCNHTLTVCGGLFS